MAKLSHTKYVSDNEMLNNEYVGTLVTKIVKNLFPYNEGIIRKYIGTDFDSRPAEFFENRDNLEKATEVIEKILEGELENAIAFIKTHLESNIGQLLLALLETAKKCEGKIYRGSILAALKIYDIEPSRNTDSNIRQELAKLGYSWEKCAWSLSASSTYWTIKESI